MTYSSDGAEERANRGVYQTAELWNGAFHLHCAERLMTDGLERRNINSAEVLEILAGKWYQRLAVFPQLAAPLPGCAASAAVWGCRLAASSEALIHFCALKNSFHCRCWTVVVHTSPLLCQNIQTL